MAKITKHDISGWLREHGLRGAQEAARSLLEGGTLPNGARYHVPAEEWSLKAIWEGSVGDVSDTLEKGMYESVVYQEAVDSTAFSVITAELISSKMIEGYNAPGYIGERLVQIVPTRLREERVAGFTHSQGFKSVGEGMPYEGASMTEKYVTTQTDKKGRSIDVTEEAIMFDQTGRILMQARTLGEEGRRQWEEDVLDGVTGTDTNVYKPSGTATTLYSSGNTNLKTSNALADYSDIEAVLLYHAQNVKDDRQGETAKPIIWMPKVLLVPQQLLFTARRIVNATWTRETTNTNNVGESPNPVADMGLMVLASPILDGLSTTTWYLGDFQKQFIWNQVYPLQTMFKRDDTEDAWRRDIVASYKARYYGGISAMDTKWVVKSTA